MKRALNAQQMKRVDAAAEEHGLPTQVLMENAGDALAQEALKLASASGRFFVLCGTGNNGGDGLVAARKLTALGRTVQVEVMALPETLESDAHKNYKALKANGVTHAPISDDEPIGPGDVVIDALLGTGLSRAPDSKYAQAIGRISSWRASGATVLAADLPSGLSADSGRAPGAAVGADVTLSFGHLKIGQIIEPGATLCGVLKLADIGIPKSTSALLIEPGVFLLEEGDVKARLPKRRSDSHKGTYGHVLVIAGSWGKTGAAALVAKACLRGGAGLVTVATRPEALIPVMAHSPEIMGLELVNDGALGPGDLNPLLEAADGKQAVVIGPGIARDENTVKLLVSLLEELSIPCVLDADALNALGGDLDVLQKARGELLLTPHPGEMAGLTGRSVAEVQLDRLGVAREVARRTQAIVLLKGARSLIAKEDGTVFVNPTGNPGLATGGSGDVLSGLCGALLAQGLTPEDAAVTACYAHGLAGDLGAAKRGQLGLVAGDLLEHIGDVWVRWSR